MTKTLLKNSCEHCFPSSHVLSFQIAGSLASRESYLRKSSDWYSRIQPCRSDLTSYFDTMRYLSRLIVECLTEGLSLPRDTYTKLETENAICNARVNHYPACPDPSKVFGIPGHTDPQMLSILYQDDVGGLQVLKDGKWIGIRPDDSTLVCNLGDTFQVNSLNQHSAQNVDTISISAALSLRNLLVNPQLYRMFYFLLLFFFLSFCLFCR